MRRKLMDELPMSTGAVLDVAVLDISFATLILILQLVEMIGYKLTLSVNQKETREPSKI
jgi:hypothetical protein